MPKAKCYDTVVLLEPIGAFQKGEQGAVVEVYIMPYEAYDIEIVTDEGQTLDLVEGVRPEQPRCQQGCILPPSASNKRNPCSSAIFRWDRGDGGARTFTNGKADAAI